MERILAWHFCGATLRNGSPIPADGETLTHDGPIKPRASGLHASRRIIDALDHAPGNLICRVECWGDVIQQGDKLVARNRRILWRVDGEPILRAMARKSALSVIHLWNAPDVVRQYLETGREDLRDAARDVAWAAAVAAARAAGRDVAWDTSWAAARDAAMAATLTAASAAAADAAWAAARAAARSAARDVAWDAANEELTRLVEAAHATQSKVGVV